MPRDAQKTRKASQQTPPKRVRLRFPSDVVVRMIEDGEIPTEHKLLFFYEYGIKLKGGYTGLISKGLTACPVREVLKSDAGNLRDVCEALETIMKLRKKMAKVVFDVTRSLRAEKKIVKHKAAQDFLQKAIEADPALVDEGFVRETFGTAGEGDAGKTLAVIAGLREDRCDQIIDLIDKEVFANSSKYPDLAMLWLLQVVEKQPKAASRAHDLAVRVYEEKIEYVFFRDYAGRVINLCQQIDPMLLRKSPIRNLGDVTNYLKNLSLPQSDPQ